MRKKLGIASASLVFFGVSFEPAFAQAPPADAASPGVAAPATPATPESKQPPQATEAPAPGVSPSASPGSSELVRLDELKRACEALGYARNAPIQPLILDAEDGLPPPTGYRLVERTRRGLWVTGTVIGSVFYGLSLTAALGSSRSEDRLLAIPIAGPFLRLGGEKEEPGRVLLALDGVAQVASAAMIYAGITFTKQLWVRDPSVHGAQGGMTVALVPLVRSEASGASLVGTF